MFIGGKISVLRTDMDKVIQGVAGEKTDPGSFWVRWADLPQLATHDSAVHSCQTYSPRGWFPPAFTLFLASIGCEVRIGGFPHTVKAGGSKLNSSPWVSYSGPGWRTSTPIVAPPTRRSLAALQTITRHAWAPTLA